MANYLPTSVASRWTNSRLWQSMLVCAAVLALAAPAPAAQVDAVKNARIARTFVQTPLYFEVNEGQFDRRVSHAARGPGYGNFLTPTETVFSFGKRAGGAHPHAVRLRLVASRTPSAIHAELPLASRSTYFIGNDRSAWNTTSSSRPEPIQLRSNWPLLGSMASQSMRTATLS